MTMRTKTILMAVALLVAAAAPAPAQDLNAIVDSLQAERRKYGATMNDDECVELINAVAWAHRDDGWGLSGKDFGKHGVRHDGVQVAHDVLHHRPTNKIWDVLGAAGAQSTAPRSAGDLGPGGPPPGSNRPWVAPVPPRGTATQPGNGGAVTPPPPPPDGAVVAKLNELIGHVATLTATVDGLRATVAGQATQLDLLTNQRLTEDWAARVWAYTDPAKPAPAVTLPAYRGCARLLGCVTLTPQ
jgi:hypothetical protein